MNNTDSRTAFNIPSFRAEDIAAGYYSYDVAVTGFWSSPVSIRFNRSGWGKAGGQWTVEVTHSSGGYESEFNQLEAERNFALACLAAVGVADAYITANRDQLEQAYQAKMLKWEAEAAATAQAAQAARDADPAVGKDAAKKLINKLYAQGTEKDAEGNYVVKSRTALLLGKARGSVARHKVAAVRTWNGTVLFSVDGARQSRKAAELFVNEQITAGTCEFIGAEVPL
jgi:hypothetical protein